MKCTSSSVRRRHRRGARWRRCWRPRLSAGPKRRQLSSLMTRWALQFHSIWIQVEQLELFKSNRSESIDFVTWLEKLRPLPTQLKSILCCSFKRKSRLIYLNCIWNAVARWNEDVIHRFLWANDIWVVIGWYFSLLVYRSVALQSN